MINTEIEKRLRPVFGQSELRLSGHTGELVYIPAEFVPHTATATLVIDAETSNKTIQIKFEYQINEKPVQERKILDIGVEMIVGAYTEKIINISIEAESFENLLSKLTITSSKVEMQKSMLTKDSYKRNYDLVSEILQDLKAIIESDDEIKSIL